MSRTLSLFSWIYFAAFNAGAVSEHLPSATTFFRSPESLFPSGQTSRTELEKTQVNQELRPSYRVSWDKKEFWMYVDQLVKDIHCAHKVLLNETSTLTEKQETKSKVIARLDKDQEAELLQISTYWAQIKDLKSGQVGWIPHKRLRAKNEDLGVFVNLIETGIRKEASYDSPALATIPKNSRLKILGFENGFLKTEYLAAKGYVDLGHIVSRADFAVWAYHNDKKWIPITHRENEFLVTPKKEKILFDEFSAFTVDPAKAVVIDSGAKLPPIRSHVHILESQAAHWAASQLPGHGLVWWKKQQWSDKAPATAEITITADELLKRPIFSIALEGGKSVKGIVSAQGVFKTEDGITWTRLSNFGDQDLPVAIHSEGRWFVGSFQSFDRGKSFEPFIRWDRLAHMIEAVTGRQPKQIRLQKIENLRKGEMHFTVDTSPGRVRMVYQLADASWSVIK
jgi:hypothetical protein